MMPIPPTWLPRLDSILDEVRTSPQELDREQVQLLFGLSRREALRLMKKLDPTVEHGRWLIERPKLVYWLQKRQSDAEREHRRRDRLTRGLMQADRLLPRPPGPFLSIAVTKQMKQASEELPTGVMLRPGVLEVAFSSLAELAQRLLETGIVLDRNFEHYAQAMEPDSAEQRQRELERQDAEFFRYGQG